MSDIPAVVFETYRKKLPCSGDSVVIRPARVKEERIWLMGNDSQKVEDLVEALTTVTQNCITEPSNFKVSEMSYNDFVWLFLEIMKISKGETIPLDLICLNKECTHEEKSIPYKISEMSTIENLGTNKGHIVKLSDNRGLELKYPTVGYMLSLTNVDFENIKKNRRLRELHLIQAHIVAYLENDSRYTFKNVDETIEWTDNNLTNKDIQKIKDWFAHEPTLVFNIKWKCSKCGQENNLRDVELIRFLGL